PYTARADDLPKWASNFDHLLSALEKVGIDGVFTDFPDLARKKY
ncbi:MAG: glycerophosphodiester phosphodiesterase, partial [Halobacteriovoraceae bacterium]|nr:glycerophosphodiester phosphodiesterase [Halobacteriovoraceae bacterium]